jgi:hypothetical protein
MKVSGCAPAYKCLINTMICKVASTEIFHLREGKNSTRSNVTDNAIDIKQYDIFH